MIEGGIFGKSIILFVVSLLVHSAKKALSTWTTGISIVQVSPSEKKITQDAVFLINFDERNYKLYDKLDTISFFLHDNEGVDVELVLLEKNIAGTSAQFLFKAKKKLKINRTYHMLIKNFAMTQNNKLFAKFVGYRQWTVVAKKNKNKPVFNGITDVKTHESFRTSAPGHSIGFKVSWNSNNIYKESIAIVRTKSGEKFLYLINNENWFGIYSGICGSSLPLKSNRKYTFNFQILDFSGNLSKKSIDYSFETAK